jgi:hypothetical protein
MIILTNMREYAGLLGLVTQDGKEITATNQEETIFWEEAFYQNALTSEEIQ